MIYTTLTKKAMKIAYEAHKNQIDKSGMPYVFHPIHIAEQMKDEKTTCVALLHDVIEDTDLTPEQLRKYGFDEAIIAALKLLTHNKLIPYMDYIRAIKENDIATAVKIADLKHNSDLSRLDFIDDAVLRRADKYKEALEILTPSGLQNPLDPEIEAVFKKFSEKYIALMETLYKDKELNEWCRSYSAYREVTSHRELKEMIYGVFMKEAYALNLMPKIAAWEPECGVKSFDILILSTKADLIYGICSAIRMDYAANGSLIYDSIANGHLYRLMYNLLHYDEIKPQEEINAGVKSLAYKQYTLEYILRNIGGAPNPPMPARRMVTYDKALYKWRTTIQLEEKRLWFLSVFINKNGILEKYSLDKEAASDSHYEFTDEKQIRNLLYEQGDEGVYLDEIFIRYLKSHSAAELLNLIMPHVTAQYHYD